MCLPSTAIAAVALLTSFAAVGRAEHAFCPFCTAASQTLRQEIQTMDVVAIGKLISDDRADIDGLASFQINKILSGDTLLKPDQAIQATNVAKVYCPESATAAIKLACSAVTTSALKVKASPGEPR